MKTPKNLAGTRRSATRSAAYGTTELSTPAATAQPSPPSRSCRIIGSSTGTASSADTVVAAAGACNPGSLAPTRRLSRMYAAQQAPASTPQASPAQSLLGPGRTRTYTPVQAPRAQSRSTRVREPASATPSGPRNSSVTASASPIRSIAVYSDTFMAAKTKPSSSVGHHCAQVNRRNGGRATGSSTAAATTCRTATTPAGPIEAKACAPRAAPSWLLLALPSIVATPPRSPFMPPVWEAVPRGRK
jgi:hypothetical protein